MGQGIINFEILALDPKGQCKAKSPKALTHALLGVSALWESPSINAKSATIDDGPVQLRVVAAQHGEGSDDATARTGYFLMLTGPLDRVGEMREGLLSHLKDAAFSPLYVLQDQVSSEIAKELYPRIYEVENALRKYLIKFMSTRIGADWWDTTVTNEVSTKAKMRKKNDPAFGPYLNNDAYLIDFGELGEIIFAQTSGYVTRDDIILKISHMKETPEAVKMLKAEVQTNYQRFFRETFADKGFQDRWRKLEKIRNKVAHCNLFALEDLREGRDLASELLDIITRADEENQKVEITSQEREAIQEQVLARSARDNSVTEQIFLSELRAEEARFKKRQPAGFVGYSRFLNIHLGSKGFDYFSIKDLCAKLEIEGKIEIYHVPQKDSEFPTAAIRSKGMGG